MGKTLAVFTRELNSYILSPIAYVVAAIYIALSSYFFTAIVSSYNLADMRSVFENMSVIFLFVAPALSMKVFAEERRMHTDELLLTSPVSLSSIVLGKFLAVAAVYALTLVISFIYPGILVWLSSPDLGPIASGYLGLFLLGSVYLAIGVFASCLTDSQVIAGVVSFGILLFLFVIDWAAQTLNGIAGKALSALAILNHVQDFEKGIINATHVVYYLSFILVFLFLTTRIVESRRWSS